MVTGLNGHALIALVLKPDEARIANDGAGIIVKISYFVASPKRAQLFSPSWRY
jgi:hypothetical protein